MYNTPLKSKFRLCENPDPSEVALCGFECSVHCHSFITHITTSIRHNTFYHKLSLECSGDTPYYTVIDLSLTAGIFFFLDFTPFSLSVGKNEVCQQYYKLANRIKASVGGVVSRFSIWYFV